MGKAFLYNCRKVVCCILLAGLLLAGPAISFAADTVCARVKIEIKQELTLERQAFDAHMRINNGLANISLEQVKVDVSFADEDGNPVLASSDPNNGDALFFIRLDEDAMENIDDVSGSGTVDPSTTADIHWLIIPAPGSSNGLASGTLYYVGARLTYTLGGEPKVTEVTPDYIFVKPMPEITLDYFLPSDVYGDDPQTNDVVEPIVPFSLGVRVKNSGHGVARKLKIESAQPKITENKQGLLIGFAIEGSEVNGQPATDSLLVDFGDIAPDSAGVARWIMTCSLSGQFVSFTADYSHSDELGGELTSLIQEVNTHTLVHDVLVDLPGRDAVRDFLATNGGSVYRIYESEVTGLSDDSGGEPEVLLQSATISGGGDTRTLQSDPTAGFMYVQLSDPFNGSKVLKEVVRSDGKIIKPENAWLSHTREGGGALQYHLNLFDVNTPGTYTLRFEDASAVPQPPVLQYIADKDAEEDTQVSFIVESSDPNGTVPALSAAPLPVGATFVDEGTGVGVFDWTPTAGQAGVYQIIYRASDGLLEATRRATITVKGFTDADGDFLDDEWELQHFGSLDRDGSGDFDRDGKSDLEEFEDGEDPAELADLAIQVAVSDPNPSIDDEIDLTITVTNNGARDATGINILDLLSGGLLHIDDDSDDSYDPVSGIWDMEDMPALAPGEAAALTIRAKVTRSGKILNIATVTIADQYDPDRSNNSAALILNGGAQSDLALALESENIPSATDPSIAVTLTVTNNGIEDATGILIEEPLPGNVSLVKSEVTLGEYDPVSGIWDVGDLASGAGAELELTLAIDSNVEKILTAALIAIDQPDPDLTNNRSSIAINQKLDEHPYIADLAIQKLVNETEVDVDEQAVFTLVVRNKGPDGAGNIAIDDLLPYGLILKSARASRGSYDAVGEQWQMETLPAGTLAVLDMEVDVTQVGEADNTAKIILLDEFDPDDGNNLDTISVAGLAADIDVIQSVDRKTVNPGEIFKFTVEVTNQGPHDATGVVVVYESPGGLLYQSHLPDQAAFDSITGQWNVGDLAYDETATLVVTYRAETAGQMVTRVGRQSSSPTDTNSTNDEALLTVVGNAPPVVSAIPGQTIDEGQSFLTIDLDDYVTDLNNLDEEIDWTHSGALELSVAIDDVTHVAAITIPHNDWYGSEAITFTATDSFGLSDESEVLFTVTAVNDVPSAAINHSFSGSEGQSINFAGSAIDVESTDLTYFWDFDYRDEFVADKQGIALKTPTWTYADDDTYTVALRVEDESRETSEIVTAQVTVTDRAPSAAFNMSTDTQDEGSAVVFTDESTSAPDAIATWSWEFGDGSESDLQSPQHTFVDNGTYTVRLTVTDDDGSADYVEHDVKIADVPPTVTMTGAAAVNEGADYSLGLSAVDQGDDTVAGWSIDWGDGIEQTIIGNPDTVLHTYADDGNYTITASATNEDDTYDAGSAVLVQVADVLPQITLTTTPAPSDEGSSVELSSVIVEPGQDGHTLIQVNWGDGTVDDGPVSGLHTYIDNGAFDIIATFEEDDTARTLRTVSIQHLVLDVPPTVTITGAAAVNEGADYSLELSAVDQGDDTVTGWSIDWGDGIEQTIIGNPDTVLHTYADDGNYTITASATNEDDTYDAVSEVTVSVLDVAPKVTIAGDANVNEGADYSLGLSAVDPGDDTVGSWSINWGDGTEQKITGNPATVAHTYADNDDYTISASATNEDGTYDAVAAVTVTVNNVAPAVDAGVDQTVAEGALVDFAGTLTDPGADSWTLKVDYGDGTAVEELDLNDAKIFATSHTYSDGGSYTVIVTVTDDDGGEGTDTLVVTVNNVAPTVDAGEDQSAEEGSLVSYSGSFLDPGADTWTATIDFGDNTGIEDLTLNSDKSYTTSHTYGDNGTYTVTVTVTDDDDGVGIDTLNVEVANVTPTITELTNDNPSTGEVNLKVFFTDPGWLDSHSSQWDFGDGSVAEIHGDDEIAKHAETSNQAAVHYYTAEGLFTASVTVTDDDGACSDPRAIAVLIDKTEPVITVFEPQAGYYRNTDEIMVDVTVEDPDSGGVSSGLVPESVEVYLDGQSIATDAQLDLSELADGFHTLNVVASDYAGNAAEQEVKFEVGPVPALVHINPHNWDLKWLDPFDFQDDDHLKDTIKAEISLENAEVETVIPTEKAARLKAGDGFGDFVVVDVVAAQTGAKPNKEKVASLTLKYVGVEEIDILAFSGNTVLDFYSVYTDEMIVIDGGQVGYLDHHTVLSSYQSDPPLLSAADIIPQTVLLNRWVPIIEDSARLITKDAAVLAQSGVIAEPPYGVVKEKKHHVWLANVGQPQQVTLEVGSQTILADEPYPVNWQDWFSLTDDGPLQMVRIHAADQGNLLKVLHHNLQDEARMYLDGNLALTILPETELIAMEVRFDRFDVMSTLDKDLLQQGGDWLVTVHNGATLKGKHPRKHIRVSDIGYPLNAKLEIGDTVVFDDQSFPINWSERYLIVDGQRQDMSIKTHGTRGNHPHLSINCKKLTREARLYLDDVLVLLISPPPEVGVSITGELELDGDPATFDGAFRGSDAIELKGKLPRDFDPPMSYQRISTSGEPALQIGDRFGEFEIADFEENYEDWRITMLEFRYDGNREKEIKFYADKRRKHLIDSYQAYPGDYFSLDVEQLKDDRVYLEIGRKKKTIELTGKKAAEIGDSFLDCTVVDTSAIPLGPPHYMALNLEYTGTAALISLTAYDGKKKDVIGIYEVDPAVDPGFTIDGSELRKGRLGENLVLEFAPVE